MAVLKYVLSHFCSNHKILRFLLSNMNSKILKPLVTILIQTISSSKQKWLSKWKKITWLRLINSSRHPFLLIHSFIIFFSPCSSPSSPFLCSLSFLHKNVFMNYNVIIDVLLSFDFWIVGSQSPQSKIHQFSIKHVSLSTFLPQVNRLYQISKMDPDLVTLSFPPPIHSFLIQFIDISF